MKYIFIFYIFICLHSLINAQDSVKGQYIVAVPESNEVLVINENSDILRTIPARNTYDAWMKENGEIVYCDHYGVQVVNEDGKITQEYNGRYEIFACQPLKDDGILIGECGSGKLIEIDKLGNVTTSISSVYDNGGHTCFRGLRKLNNGNYLVSHYADKTVREISSNGVLVKAFKRPHNVYAAERLKDGRTVITDQYCISIYDKRGDLIWMWNGKGNSELGINHLTGFKYLDTDEIIVCNWLGHPPYSKGVSIFKINLNKEITWTFKNNKIISPANINLIK